MAAGTVFFRFVEGWSWLDAYFFTAVTVTTVGYGNLVPATALGKIGATVLIFAGIGVHRRDACSPRGPDGETQACQPRRAPAQGVTLAGREKRPAFSNR